MLAQNLIFFTFFSFLSGINAAPGLEKRAVSTDGTCSSTVTCVGSGFGDCCSTYGYCGSGDAYCGTTSGTSASSSGSGTSSGLKVSTDGMCGNGVGCQGSAFGDCCSQYGYCGSTSDHCAAGCQSAFGTCTSSSASGKVSATVTSKSASATAKSSSSTKPSASSKAASSSKPVSSAAAATTSACTVTPTQIVVNPSFEDGANPWTFGGGGKLATNGDTNPWGFNTPDGSKYALLVSSSANATSTVSQNLASIDYNNAWKLSFDWQFMMSSTSRGPPSTKCTLTATLNSGFITVASWMRPGTQGGTGHVESTLTMGIGGGDLTFTFGCSDLTTSFQVGVVIDNVQFSSSC